MSSTIVPARLRGLASPVAGLVLALALAGCAGAGSPTPTPVATPNPSDALGLATGSETCTEMEAPSMSPAPAAPDPSILTMECRRAFSDARLSGLLREQVHLEAGQPVVTIWGTGTLSNDGGIWVCDVILIGTMVSRMGSRNDVCVGTDGYRGLTAYIQGPTRDYGTSFGLIGWIVETTGAP